MDYSTFLLCDEKLMLSPSPQALLPDNCSGCSCCSSSRSLAPSSDIADEELQVTFKGYIQRECSYAPDYRYVEYLRKSSGLLAARFRAVRWIVLACDRLNLALGAAFNAVNYLDRFISLNCCTWKWETWMIELLCIACVSIASKLDEVFIPSIHDFREDLDHTFDPKTVHEMELTVLTALDWRLCCITPLSYVDLLTCHPNSSLHCFGQLLLSVLFDFRFLYYGACVVATSVTRCGRRGTEIQDSLLNRLTSETNTGHQVELCCKIMEEYIAGPITKSHQHPPSPVTVIPMQKTKIFDCYVDIDELFCKATKDLLW